MRSTPQSRRRSRGIKLLAIGLLILPPAVSLFADEKVSLTTSTHPATATHPATTQSAAASQAAARAAKEAKRKEDEIARVMDFFKLTQPELYEQAKTLQNTDPERFEKLVRPAVNTVNRLEELRKRSPKLFELTMKDFEFNYKSLRLARQLKRADLAGPDREKLSAELTSIVSSQFDIRQQIRQQEIEDLKNQLKDLDAKLQGNENVKETLIKKRVEDLIDKPPRLDW
jgi:hypothetical protein